MGRKRKKLTRVQQKMMQFRLHPEDAERLTAWADHEGMSRQALMERVLMLAVELHEAEQAEGGRSSVLLGELAESMESVVERVMERVLERSRVTRAASQISAAVNRTGGNGKRK